MQIIDLPDMDGLIVLPGTADRPVTPSLFTLDQQFKRAMHRDEQDIVAGKQL
jgi:hypothetical protein